jgi:hypothetical protein
VGDLRERQAEPHTGAEPAPVLPRPAGPAPGPRAGNRESAAALSGPVTTARDVVALTRGAGNAAVAQRLADQPLRPTWYSSADPLAPYRVFKAGAPGAYAALDATARQHTLQRAGEEAEPAPGTGWRTRTEVPVAALLRPALPPYGALAPLRTRLWPLLTQESQDAPAAAAVIRDEVVGRWATRNDQILGSEVQVRLLLPDEAPPAPWIGDEERGVIGLGDQAVLEFTLQGHRIRTADGSIDPVTLDLLGSNDFESSVAEVAAEAAVVAQAADLLRATAALAEAEGQYWQDVAADLDGYAMADVTGHLALLQMTVVLNGDKLDGGGYPSPWAWRLQAFLSDHPEYAPEFAASFDALRAVTDQALPVFEDFADRHEAQSVPDVEFAEMKPGIDAAKDRMGDAWDEGEHFVAVCEFLGWGLGKVVWGTANTATGDYFEARHQGLTAYREGRISKNQFDELDRAASGRALASVTVFTALSLVTLGLGGAALGAGASLGRTMLVAGAANATVTAGTMTTTSVYTRQQDFADPTVQAIWGQGAYSVGQIATGTLVAGAIGAAVPVAGMALSKVVGWVRGVQPPTSALALRQAGAAVPELPPPAGWAAEEIGPGMFRLTHPDVPGEVILTSSSFRYQVPAGDGMRVEFDMPLTAAAGGAKALAPGGPGWTAGDVDDALARGFSGEGPMVSSTHDAAVLDIGSGPQPAPLGIGDDVVRIIRTDVVETFPIDRLVDAEAALADDLVGSAQAIIINNPYAYVPDLEELARAVRPGGKIIIQGHREANKFFRKLVAKGPPKGFVQSVDEGFDPLTLPAAVQADPDLLAEVIRRSIMGGPFRQSSGAKTAQPNVRVVYEKPIEGADALGARLGRESRGARSRFDYVAGRLNALQLGQRNAADAAAAATEAMGLNLVRTTNGDDIILSSVRTGGDQPILIVQTDGTVLRGTATITRRTPVDPADPLELTDIVADPPILPGR